MSAFQCSMTPAARRADRVPGPDAPLSSGSPSLPVAGSCDAGSARCRLHNLESCGRFWAVGLRCSQAARRFRGRREPRGDPPPSGAPVPPAASSSSGSPGRRRGALATRDGRSSLLAPDTQDSFSCVRVNRQLIVRAHHRTRVLPACHPQSSSVRNLSDCGNFSSLPPSGRYNLSVRPVCAPRGFVLQVP